MSAKTPKLTLNAAEAARILGIGERLLQKLTTQKRIPHIRLGRRVLYPPADDLEKWAKEEFAKSTADGPPAAE